MHGEGSLIIYNNYKYTGNFERGRISGAGRFFKNNTEIFVKECTYNYVI